ncbi:MAG: type IV toxin-antitoxin system AbiEi family antitoxin domain-containing protein [Propionibacteriaceae bacterium]|nr:type IV toxin-antitoxin system AbiEi family antitoxin domain-containing protein [Propionibacteriaceae bacterium]
MFARIDVPPQFVALAAQQSGVFSIEQAESFGITKEASRRLHRHGHWHRIAHGVSSANPDPSWMGHAWAGILQCERGVLGGAAAGHLYGLCDAPSMISVWMGDQSLRSRQRWRFRHGKRRGVFAPSRVRIEDAALEMCEDQSDSGIVTVLASAVGTRRTTSGRLRSVALGIPNLRNRGLILDILADVALGVESPLERQYLIDVERKHCLPGASRQVSVSLGTRTDVGYLEFGVLVELDGRVWHEGLAASADMARDNQHRLASFITLRFGWAAVVGNPCNVARQVADALVMRGWSGRLRRCSSCP